MNPELVGVIGVIVLVVLMFSRVWVGVSMILVGFIGFGVLAGWEQALNVLGAEPYTNVAFYPITAIPLFILMGAIVTVTGISTDLFNTANKWIGQLRGGLAMASIAACAAFAAISGSSSACAATMGKVALPEMKKHNYDDKIASASIAAGGTMGILIPPSMGFILYGILVEQSVGKLFIAGIVPGILQAVFYIILIFVLCRVNPLLGPPGEKATMKEKVFSLKNTWAMLLLFLLVMGGIYMGVFTPTEAGAIGSFGAIIIALVSRRFNWGKFRFAMVDTAKTTAMIIFMIVGAFIFMRFMTISQLAFALGDFVAALTVSKYIVLIAIVVMYIILGCFFDIYSAIVLTLPIVYPVILAVDFDPIWFGVVMVRMMEVGAITPPFGMNVFILSGVSDIPVGKIFRGITPFVITDFLHIALLCAIPALSTFLPEMM